MAAATRGCRGAELSEYGLLREAGRIAFTDGAKAIGSARMMRLALSYARAFGAMVVQHPEEPSLAGAGSATRASWPRGSACPASRPRPRPSWWRATWPWPG
jgi:dihydroorotase